MISDGLEKPYFSKMLSNNHISYSIKYKTDIPGICGTSKMSINLLLLTLLIKWLKNLSDVILGIIIGVWTYKDCKQNYIYSSFV